MKCLLPLVILLTSSFAVAQTPSEELTNQEFEDWSWTPQSKDTLKVKFGVAVPRYNFTILAPSGLTDAKFLPNSPSKSSLGFSYRNLGFTASVQNPVETEDKEKYGSSSAVDFQLRFFGKRTYEFFLQAYDGYYIENSAELDPSFANSSKKIFRDDIKTRNFGFNFYWNLDEENFSQAMAFDQAGFQKESDWGLSAYFHASRNSIAAKEAFIPAASASQFGSLSDLDGMQRDTAGPGIAIGGIAVYQNFYATAFVGLGLGYQRVNLEYVVKDDETSESLGSFSTGRLGLGYNGQRHSAGFQVISDAVSTTIEDGNIESSNIELMVFYSYRFEGINIPPANEVSSWFD
ncbi:hypothetical protein AZI87_13375 [Bdellovibrio bacteriovorus]|uniref:Uncharacterized protein n=1 Tax=Bdellovibrio bacteriovorus TaxID=959 RepID=A0A162G3E0_BDEBC|nr:DUF4421 family protein [Bdellovibrio bacteriovorus]KYG64228.1 hypothetical protein AZI87_13375 [Bdellovibrio bacteriovorus]